MYPTDRFYKGLFPSYTLPATSLLDSARRALDNPFVYYKNAQMKKRIDPRRNYLKIVKKPVAIILFELFPINELSRLNEFIATLHNRETIDLVDCRRTSIPLIEKIEPIEHVSNITAYIFYNFGENIEIIIVCNINEETLPKDPRGIPDALEETQIRIEEKLPLELHGLYYTGIHTVDNTVYLLPSIYLYGASELSSYVTGDSYSEVEPLDRSRTIRAKFEILISDFRTQFDDPKSNTLTGLGFYEDYLVAAIDSSLLISYNPYRTLNYFPYSMVGNYVGIYLGDSLITQDQIVFDFIRELSALLHIEKVMIEIRRGVAQIEIEEYPYDQIDLGQLNVRRRSSYIAIRQLENIEDTVEGYDVNIIKALIKGDLAFSNEERSTYVLEEVNQKYSISDHFRGSILEIRKEIYEEIAKKNRRIERWIAYIDQEIEIGTSGPVINTLFKGIESDVISRIKKLERHIDQNRIESWLLNFETDEERLMGLKLLDKLTVFSSNQIVMMGIALFNKLKSILDPIPLDECRFTSIGGITSGSTQVVRTFQENNRLPKNWFIYNSEILKLNDIKSIIFLDDFVGSGNTFIKWYEENNSKRVFRDRFDSIYYCSLGAFENGISKIKKYTGVETVTGRLIEESEKVLDGKLYSQKDRQKIRKIVEKYDGTRIPTEYSRGYDNCQLLYAFENNIPNNSLGLLWFSHNWTPLLERK